MNRRRWMQWGCAHCVTLAGLSQAQTVGADWTAPPRFGKPDLATDEGGLWAMMDREETRLRRSPFRIRDEALGTYLTDLVCRLGGDHCPDVRVYAVRAPFFNASMAPNGMMQVWSGLMLRVDNEAQLAAVLGHEIGHYLQRHSLERLRDVKSRAAFGSFLAAFGIIGAIGAIATLAGGLAFSRDHERDADRIGLQLMRRSGLDPREAALVWGNLMDELRATPGNDPAKDSILFATHPAGDERKATLDALSVGATGEKGTEAWRARLAPLRRGLLEDEIKRNKPYETVALMTRLLGPEPGHPDLLHCRGEALRLRGLDGDQERALADISAASAHAAAPPAAHRSLAEMHRAASRIEPARQAYRRYIDAAPGAPDADMIRHTLESLQ